MITNGVLVCLATKNGRNKIDNHGSTVCFLAVTMAGQRLEAFMRGGER